MSSLWTMKKVYVSEDEDHNDNVQLLPDERQEIEFEGVLVPTEVKGDSITIFLHEIKGDKDRVSVRLGEAGMDTWVRVNTLVNEGIGMLEITSPAEGDEPLHINPRGKRDKGYLAVERYSNRPPARERL